MDKRLEQVPLLFPEPMRAAVRTLLNERGERVEELRLRTGCFAAYVMDGRESRLGERELPAVRAELLEEIVRRASGNSVYAVQEQLRKGYLVLPFGHRLGICGTASLEDGAVKTIRNYQSLSLRLAGERTGCADSLVRFVRAYPGSTLILGPPGAGKTTILRDLVRQISDRFACRVGLVDERGELAACRDGIPQLDVGIHTDVLTDFPKASAIELLIRTMAPEWIAVDEITASEDVEVINRSSYCGVHFFATAHASSMADLSKRPLYRRLLEMHEFENIALIRPDRSIVCERIMDGLQQDSRGGIHSDGFSLGRISCCHAAATCP